MDDRTLMLVTSELDRHRHRAVVELERIERLVGVALRDIRDRGRDMGRAGEIASAALAAQSAIVQWMAAGDLLEIVKAGEPDVAE